MNTIMNDDESKKIIELLKSLKKIEVPSNFDEKLFAKINPYEHKTKESFWEKIFSLPLVYTSSAAIVVASIILIVVLINPNNNYNPFYELPKERENFVFTSTQQFEELLNDEFKDYSNSKNYDIESDISIHNNEKQLKKSMDIDLEKNDVNRSTKENEQTNKSIDDKQNETSYEVILSESSTNQKKFLNFTAVSLTQEEKMVIDSLKNCLFKNKDTLRIKSKIEN